jgi:hypothetical protein
MGLKRVAPPVEQRYIGTYEPTPMGSVTPSTGSYSHAVATRREHGMVDIGVLQQALSECWAAEVSGATYYEALGERFPDHCQEFDVLASVEKTTRDLIEPVARRYDVSIDHDAAERIGVEVAQVGHDWREALENALGYTPDTLRMYTNLAGVLPDNESALGHAVVDHERAQIVLFESAVSGNPEDWSAIDAFLEEHGARRPS